MDKKVCAFIFLFSFVFGSSYVHANRAPSVNPIVEIDIEETQQKNAPQGFNFEDTSSTTAKRVPANIVKKDSSFNFQQYLGLVVLFLGLPLFITALITKKMSKKISSELGEEASTFKLSSVVSKEDDDEDDGIDFPKAS